MHTHAVFICWTQSEMATKGNVWLHLFYVFSKSSTGGVVCKCKLQFEISFPAANIYIYIETIPKLLQVLQRVCVCV